jgi:hypothetical protein
MNKFRLFTYRELQELTIALADQSRCNETKAALFEETKSELVDRTLSSMSASRPLVGNITHTDKVK